MKKLVAEAKCCTLNTLTLITLNLWIITQFQRLPIAMDGHLTAKYCDYDRISFLLSHFSLMPISNIHHEQCCSFLKIRSSSSTKFTLLLFVQRTFFKIWWFLSIWRKNYIALNSCYCFALNIEHRMVFHILSLPFIFNDGREDDKSLTWISNPTRKCFPFDRFYNLTIDQYLFHS